MKATSRSDFLHGAVLKVTREDTLPDIEKHLLIMKESGFNIAVIWPSAFWWEEKKEGYPFNTGKEILRIAEKLGMKIIMELAGQISSLEYMPDFLMKKEYYSYDENGNINRGYDSYGFLNFLHPEVNDIICKHFSLTARTYRDFPALLAYDVFNVIPTSDLEADAYLGILKMEEFFIKLGMPSCLEDLGMNYNELDAMVEHMIKTKPQIVDVVSLDKNDMREIFKLMFKEVE